MIKLVIAWVIMITVQPTGEKLNNRDGEEKVYYYLRLCVAELRATLGLAVSQHSHAVESKKNQRKI